MKCTIYIYTNIVGSEEDSTAVTKLIYQTYERFYFSPNTYLKAILYNIFSVSIESDLDAYTNH